MLRGIVLLFFSLISLTGWAQAQVSDVMAKRQIEESYGVQALKVRGGEIDERRVWFVTVMVPAGDSNDAYMVSTLAVDQETGRLVPAFRHRPSGYELPEGLLRHDRTEAPPDALRTGTWR